VTTAGNTEVPAASVNLDLTSAEFSWIRSDLSNLRTLLSWVRTSVSMIGFGFTIYNFYSGFFEQLGSSRVDTAARNLGLALVGFGTLAMVIAVWNYCSLNQYLASSPVCGPDRAAAGEPALVLLARRGRGGAGDRRHHLPHSC
jgi:putative membrane protein